MKGDKFISKDFLKDYNKIVFCNFEHYSYDMYVKPLFQWLEDIKVDEIWEWQIPLLDKYPLNLKDKVKFMPMRYIPEYEQYRITDRDNKYAFMFSGVLHPRRNALLYKMSLYYFPFKVLNGITYKDNTNEFKDCNYVLNIHGQENFNQEQLRICELLSLNMPIVSEKSPINYFQGLVPEIDYNNIMQKPWLLCQSNIKVDKNANFDVLYKNKTYTDEAFEKYRNDLLKAYHK